ncbi:hypothetical protein BJ165DRAFT_1534719 [Panaeolus papilionaceus]|nr:hypothetical protein BJ165DRAFT_1534719 [Panaeolus papilionaceus]
MPSCNPAGDKVPPAFNQRSLFLRKDVHSFLKVGHPLTRYDFLCDISHDSWFDNLPSNYRYLSQLGCTQQPITQLRKINLLRVYDKDSHLIQPADYHVHLTFGTLLKADYHLFHFKFDDIPTDAFNLHTVNVQVLIDEEELKRFERGVPVPAGHN